MRCCDDFPKLGNKVFLSTLILYINNRICIKISVYPYKSLFIQRISLCVGIDSGVQSATMVVACRRVQWYGRYDGWKYLKTPDGAISAERDGRPRQVKDLVADINTHFGTYWALHFAAIKCTLLR